MNCKYNDCGWCYNPKLDLNDGCIGERFCEDLEGPKPLSFQSEVDKEIRIIEKSLDTESVTKTSVKVTTYKRPWWEVYD